MTVMNVDDQRGQQITFRVNQAVRVRFFSGRNSSFRALSQPTTPPISIDRFAVRTQEPQGDLRSVAVERLADEVPGFVNHRDDCAAVDFVDVANVAAINPEMSLADASGSARADAD